MYSTTLFNDDDLDRLVMEELSKHLESKVPDSNPVILSGIDIVNDKSWISCKKNFDGLYECVVFARENKSMHASLKSLGHFSEVSIAFGVSGAAVIGGDGSRLITIYPRVGATVRCTTIASKIMISRA